MNLKVFLNQPYPTNDKPWQNIIFISLFITLFLLVFQPFGTLIMDLKHKLLILLGYGLITFLVAALNQIIIPRALKKTFEESNWTILKNILWMLWIFFTIGLGNYFYTNYTYSYTPFRFSEIIIFQVFTLIVGIIPVVLFTSLRYNYLYAKNNKMAGEMNKQLQTPIIDQGNQMISLSAENEKVSLKIALNDLYYIESTGNYIKVHYLKLEKLHNLLLRSTLKKAESDLSGILTIVKCHRAFLVNIAKVSQVKGNSQGYRLILEYPDQEIPVARNYSKSIKELILSHQN